MVEHRGSQWFIKDVSVWGTFVNGKQLPKREWQELCVSRNSGETHRCTIRARFRRTGLQATS